MVRAPRMPQVGPGLFDTAEPEAVVPGVPVPTIPSQAAEAVAVPSPVRVGTPRRAAPTALIVEADGGSRGNPGPAAYGALVRDARTGDILDCEALRLGEATNNVAEYSGLIAGLEMARAIAPAAIVEVRMDSRLVIEQMAGRWRIKHPALKELAQRVQALRPRRVNWVWVPREQNRDADRLLNDALNGRTRVRASS